MHGRILPRIIATFWRAALASKAGRSIGNAFCACAKQEFDHRRLTHRIREGQRRRFVVDEHTCVDVGPIVNERLRRFDASSPGCAMQRRPVDALRIGIGAVMEQRL